MEDMSSELNHVKDPSSAESSFRELDHVFLQKQTRIWLGEVLLVRFDENIAVADLLADGEVLLQVSKVVWNMYYQHNGETEYCKTLIDEHRKLGKHGRRYMPYSNVDKFLKVCQFFGLTGVDIFSPSDVVEKQDTRRVCMCIRSLSKKARSKHLNVPDFDVVSHNIEMPTELVDGLRRRLEKALLRFAGPTEYASRRVSIAKYLQAGELDSQGDILAKFYGAESNCEPSEFGSDLFVMLDRNDSLLSELLSSRWPNGYNEMDESIEMSPCSVLCWEEKSSVDGWEGCTLTYEGNELNEYFLSGQEDDPSHLLSTKSCTASKINMGCSPNLMKVFIDDDQTSRNGIWDTTNGDNLRTDQVEVVDEDAIQVKNKLHKRLILGSFAGGAVFGVLFFVYQIRSRLWGGNFYYGRPESKKTRPRPVSYKHQETAHMGQQKPKEAAVYPGERISLKR